MLADANEEVCFDARRHGVVLARPVAQAIVLAAAGGALLTQPWPLAVPGAILVLISAPSGAGSARTSL